MNPNVVKFTKHAMKRGYSRGLYKYINKEKFFYDAEFLDGSRARLKDCVYVFKNQDDKIKIITMYKYE